MDNTILLSIIIPVYNGEKYISRCISSIYSQVIDREDFEVIVINDGSTDNTASIINGLKKQFNNLKLVSKSNEGVSVARNIGIELANGTFVAFIDSDDELLDSSLKRVLEVIDESEIELLITDMWNYDGGKVTKRKSPLLEAGEVYSGIEAFKIGYQRTNAGGAICKKSFIQENKLCFPVGVSNGEDTIFFSEFQTLCTKMKYEKIDFYKINFEYNSASRSLDKNKINGFCRAVVSMNALRYTLGKRNDNRIIEYTLYLLLSNLIHVVTKTKELDSNYVKTIIKSNQILPIDNSKFISEKFKSTLLNKCWYLFYFLVAVKNKCQL